MAKLKIRKGGPKRKTNVVRDASGRSRGEIIDLSVVLAQPHRRWSSNPRDQLLGYPLGRLYVQNYIDRDQLEAGDEWAALVRAHARILGIPVGSPKSPMTEMVSGGFYHWETAQGDDDDGERQKRINRIRGLYDDCFVALGEIGLTLGVGHKILNLCREICIQEVNEVVLWRERPSQIGNLRSGLNVLWKTLGHGK